MIDIVPQSGRAAHWSRPSQPFLALPAPTPIAGLLPARVPSSLPAIEIVKVPLFESRLDRQRALWAAQDAELTAFLVAARERWLASIARSQSSTAVYPVQSTTLEVYCAR